MVTKAQLIKQIDKILAAYPDDDYNLQFKTNLHEVKKSLSFDVAWGIRELPVNVAIKRIESNLYMLSH